MMVCRPVLAPRIGWNGLALLTLLCASFHDAPLLRAQPSNGEPASSTSLVDFNIESQSLGSAVAAFAATTRYQVLYGQGIRQDIPTKGLRGSFTPEMGLQRLLEDTGVTYRFTDANSFTLDQSASIPVAPPSPDQPQSQSIDPNGRPNGTGAPIAKPVKVPPIMVKELRERDDAQTYVAEEATTATRTDTPIHDVPQSIQVITRKVIEEQRAFRLQSTLENISGINAADSAASLYDNFIIRGFAATDRSYFRNGLLDPFAQFTASDTYNIRRLEILKGPAAVLYGQGDPGGVINVITDKPLPNAGYMGNVTLGNFNFYRSELDVTGPLNSARTVLYRLNVAGQKAGSFIDFANRDLAAIAPSITWIASPRTTLVVEADYLRRWSNDPYGLPAQGTILPNINGPIPRNRSVTLGDFSMLNRTSYRFGYDLTHQLNDRWSIRNAFRHTIVEDDADNLYAFPSFLEPDQRTLQRLQVLQPGVARRHANSMVTNVAGHLRLFEMNHTLLTGVELRQEKTDQFLFTFAPAPPLDLFAPDYSLRPLPFDGDRLNNRGDNKTAAFYVQDQITILPNLKFLGGLRFDYVHQSTQSFTAGHSSDNTAVSPRLGLVYQPIEPLSLYTSWTKGFQPSSPSSFNPNGDLFKPERSTQYEVGMKGSLLDNRLSATLAWFHLTRENLLTPNPEPALAAQGFSVQTGEQRSQGIELDVAAELIPGWNVISGYAYTDAEVTKDNDPTLVAKRLANVPYNKFTLWSTYFLQEGALKGFGIGGGLFAYSNRNASIFGDQIDIPGYVRADAAVYYNRDLHSGNWLGAKALQIAVNMRNLLDQRYIATSQTGSQFFFFGEPRTVLATVGMRF
jgi:iron complex outermembrane receptor protein